MTAPFIANTTYQVKSTFIHRKISLIGKTTIQVGNLVDLNIIASVVEVPYITISLVIVRISATIVFHRKLIPT